MRTNPAVAAVLSVVPGLGQLYTTQPVKGVVFLVAFVVSVPLVYYVVGMVTIPLLWGWSGWDAYRAASSASL